MSTPRIDPRFTKRFLVAIVAELLYLLVRNRILEAFPDGILREAAWSLWRLPFIGLYLWLARPFVFPLEERRGMPSHPLLLVAIALSLAELPVTSRTGDWDYRIVLAFTAVLPAVREELLYRVILQGYLEVFVGPVAAIFATAVVFTAYHYGAQDFHALNVVGIFAAGVFLGAIYQRTHSFMVVAVLHAFIDIAFALVPNMSYPAGIALLLEIFGILCALAWWRLDVERFRR